MTRKIPLDMGVGYSHKMKSGLSLVITSYSGWKAVGVEFKETGFKTNTTSSAIRCGAVKDLLNPSIYGIGFVGAGRRVPTANLVATKCYTAWHNMITRCYSEASLKINPTYVDCTVCKEWHNFQNFADWYDVNYIDGFDLDKDIIISGNREYSPDACSFVSKQENSDKANAKSYKFRSPCGNVVEIKNLNLFCKENGLTPSNMYFVNSGRNSHHKKWTKA